MRVLKRGIKGLMSIGLVAWAICAFAIVFNGVASGEEFESIVDTLFIFTSITGLFEGLLGVVVLTINEIKR